jgi:hypothetical protein
MEVARIQGELNGETQGYTDYCMNVRHRLRELLEMMASSFDEVKVRCLHLPAKGTKVEEMINWVVREVQTMLNTVWQLNVNFAILAIKGVLIMLNNERCQEPGHLHRLATSSDASILQDVPDNMRKLAG